MSDTDARLRSLRRSPMTKMSDLPDNLEGSAEAVRSRLPHRPPMLLIDELVGWDKEREIIAGRRHIDAQHLGLEGHFPGDPVIPGTLLLEMLGQLGVVLFGLVLAEEQRESSLDVRATKILGAHFLREVRPGDEVKLLVRAVEYDTMLGECEAQAVVGDQVAAAMIGEVMVL